MKQQALRLVLVAVVLMWPAAGAAQTLTGTITGKVMDQQGGVLPGATVTLTGKTGSQMQVSDTRGEYRFVALNPGLYDIRAELQGFKPRGESAIDLGANKTIEVRLTLAVGGVSETVEVTASAVTVDTSTTATDTKLSSNLLFSMPMSRTNAAVNTLNYAPGVNSGSAFGGNSDYANALLLDGVDTRDPEGGSAWTFFNYNIIEEVQVDGLGQPAEYGGFTGAVVNTITKSGGNRFSSLFEMRYTSSKFASNNVSNKVITLNPSLAAAVKVNKMTDYTVQLGGPFIKDKLFFFGSVQRYSVDDDPVGPRTKHTEVSPRINLKLTWQLTPSDVITGSVAVRQLQPDRPRRHDGVPGTDGQPGLTGVDLERPVSQGVRRVHLPRGEADGLLGLLRPDADRPEPEARGPRHGWGRGRRRNDGQVLPHAQPAEPGAHAVRESGRPAHVQVRSRNRAELDPGPGHVRRRPRR